MDALIGDKGKTYGLILRGKKAKEQSGASSAPVEKPNIFGDESDEDDREFAKKFQNFDSRKETMRAQMKKQTQINLENVLAEDPSVFEYDSIYDSMHEDRERQTEIKRDAEQRKPKYMAKLLKTAEERKLERELQNDRKVQKELEAEGEEFRGKEKFVTASYKKKMAELKALEERRRQESLVEDAFDVTKQDGLSGFYRYMLHNTGAERAKEEKSADRRERSPLRDSEAGEIKPKSRVEERGREERGRDREEGRRRDKEDEKKKRQRDEEGKEEERRRDEEGERKERKRREEGHKGKEEDDSEGREKEEAEEAEGKKEKKRKRADGGETLTERRRREMVLAAQALFSRRADESSVSAARARYLARRQNRAGPIVEEDSD